MWELAVVALGVDGDLGAQLRVRREDRAQHLLRLPVLVLCARSREDRHERQHDGGVGVGAAYSRGGVDKELALLGRARPGRGVRGVHQRAELRRGDVGRCLAPCPAAAL